MTTIIALILAAAGAEAQATDSAMPNTITRGVRRHRLGLLLVWLSICALILGTVAVLGGGFTLRTAAPRISIHNPLNPFAGAVIFACLAVGLSGASAVAQQMRKMFALVEQAAPWVCGLLAATVFAVSVSRGSFVAAGADASGYLHQALLWERGSLTILTPVALDLKPVHDGQVFAPLGFRPASDRSRIVPTYPPGYPITMALARAAAGDGAEFGVIPIASAALIIATFTLGARLGDPLVGLLSAAMMAASPTHLFQALQPMSDVLGAFWWTLGVILLMSGSMRLTVAAGFAAAMASIVRPNLFALVPMLTLFLAWCENIPQRRLARTLVFVSVPAAAALAFSLYQRALYGATTETGYGHVSGLFSLAHLPANVALYSSWISTTHTPLLLISVLAPMVLARSKEAVSRLERHRAIRVAASLLAMFGVLFAFYCLYYVFDTWAYVRFLLPALSGVFVCTALVIVVGCRRISHSLGVVVFLVIFAAVLTFGFVRARDLGVFSLRVSDERHRDVASFSRTLGDKAVFLAVQHSGSLSYYTDGPVLRWDWIEPSELDTLVEQLRTNGHRIYVVLDDWEEPQLRARFAGTQTFAKMSRPVLTTNTVIRSLVYELRPSWVSPVVTLG